jgi:beta-galactosidase
MDLCGFPKPAYHYWKASWTGKLLVYVFPAWTFLKSMTGKSLLVRAYSNCDRVELLLNGKSFGTQAMPRYRYADWHIPYTPGRLVALGYDRGKIVAKYTVETAGRPVALRLASEVRDLAANGEAVAPIRVEVVDESGRVVPDANNLIRFSVSGAGTLAGVANGDPASHESNVANQRTAFRGLCMVLVRATDRSGTITLTAQSHGLAPARIVIHSAPVRGARLFGQSGL